jgi:D-arabinose 1-dehydrogenase-like Zn-dependent alcohol dehydrogenase
LLANWSRRMAALDRGGTLACAGIHLTDIPALNYQRHHVPGAATAQRHRQPEADEPISCSG